MSIDDRLEEHTLPPPVRSSSSTHDVDGWKLQFTGQGDEYFKIWIVNLALTILTLGIYSAWAKVRRLRYFYGNTTLAGSTFDFHGSPTAILKGRLIAFVVLAAYSVAPRISLSLYAMVAVVILIGFPWLYWRSLRFRLGNSSYRGARFRFLGTLRGAYSAVLPPALLFLGINVVLALTGRTVDANDAHASGQLMIKVVSLYAIALLVWPYYYHRLRAYQHGHAAFGASPFSYHGRAAQFYRLAGMMLLYVVAMIAVVGAAIYTFRGLGMLLGFLLFFFIALCAYAGIFAIIPFAMSRTQNIVWNSTRLDDARFSSRLSFRRLLVVELVNFLMTAITFGLFRPFAAVRSARVRIEALTFDGDPAVFEAAAIQTGGATGVELGEMIGFDIAL